MKMEVIREDNSNVDKKVNSIVVDWLAGTYNIILDPYMSSMGFCTITLCLGVPEGYNSLSHFQRYC